MQPFGAPFQSAQTTEMHSESFEASFTASTSLSTLMTRLLVVISLIAQVLIAWRYWSLTWDDSAITLGFARTFALTGRIEPTPGSGIVEGYSTTLWMLLMALAAKLTTSPASLLVVAKISSLLLNLTNIFLIRRWFVTWTSETCANLIAGSMGCGLMFYETINGMETPLLLALVMLMLLLKPLSNQIGRTCYLIAGAALLLTRWEAAWLLVPFVLVEGSIRLALVDAATWLSVFLISNLARWKYFGSILPNTIIAKRGAPYSPPSRSLEIYRHLIEPINILAACKVMVILLIASLLYEYVLLKKNNQLNRLRRSLQTSWQLRFSLVFVLFSLILSTAIGQNWGPQFRSFYSGWPFLFGILIFPTTLKLRGRILTSATVILCLFALLRMAVHIRAMNDPYGPEYMPGATIVNVAATNNLIAEVQAASRHQQIVYAGPDMGGILLYSNEVQVVDLGLLCDPVLARQRYASFESYVLEQRKPDIIEVHQLWTVLTNLKNSRLFRERYRPVFVDGRRVFISLPLIAAIDPHRLVSQSFNSDGYPTESDMPPPGTYYSTPDYLLNKKFGTYLSLK